MEQITAFKTSDGKIFESPSAATIHESEMRIKKNIEGFFDKSDMCDPEFSNVIKYVFENKNELREILNDNK